MILLGRDTRHSPLPGVFPLRAVCTRRNSSGAWGSNVTSGATSCCGIAGTPDHRRGLARTAQHGHPRPGPPASNAVAHLEVARQPDCPDHHRFPMRQLPAIPVLRGDQPCSFFFLPDGDVVPQPGIRLSSLVPLPMRVMPSRRRSIVGVRTDLPLSSISTVPTWGILNPVLGGGGRWGEAEPVATHDASRVQDGPASDPHPS